MSSTPSSLLPPPSTLFDDLTKAERRVAELLVEGLTNKEIANLLELSLATVKNHVASIFRRTGIHSRTRLIVAVSRAK